MRAKQRTACRNQAGAVRSQNGVACFHIYRSASRALPLDRQCCGTFLNCRRTAKDDWLLTQDPYPVVHD